MVEIRGWGSGLAEFAHRIGRDSVGCLKVRMPWLVAKIFGVVAVRQLRYPAEQRLQQEEAPQRGCQAAGIDQCPGRRGEAGRDRRRLTRLG